MRPAACSIVWSENIRRYTRQQIADISVQAHQLLQTQGVTISLLEFMREIDQATSLAPVPSCGMKTLRHVVTSLTTQRKP